MSQLTVVVAPDSFKGSAPAPVVAAALAAGWHGTRPDDELRLLPLADGGEGTVDAFLGAVPGAVAHHVTVPGPLGAPVRTRWAGLPDGTAVVDLAGASGLPLLDAPAPWDATTRGLGAVLAAVLDAGAGRVLVGLGGSASTDGGAGALRELGLRVLDSEGEPVADGARGLLDAAVVDRSGLRPLPPGGVDVLVDVTSPLLGPSGAAAVFGPQKGATPDDVPALDAALARWAALLGGDPTVPGTGAAGGTGHGLAAWGAALVPGAAAVAAAVGLDDALVGADLVLTGEGRLDGQSLGGKAVGHVLGVATAAGLPAAVVAGVLGEDADPGPWSSVVVTAELAGTPEASLADPGTWLRAAGAALAARATSEVAA